MNCTQSTNSDYTSVQAERGFVTIATGDQKYYQMARNLLHSYKLNGNSSLPFALICDKDCEIAREFDHAVIIPHPHHSFLDKLSLSDTSPYQEAIFIDADSLVLQDTNPLWEDFAQEDDVSCYGRILPLDSKDGWFYYEGMGNLQSQLKYNVSMHGGIYYHRKTQRCQDIFHKAIELVDQYHEYSFYYFKKPADEPVLALSMALANCKPCSKESRIMFYITHKDKIHISAAGKLHLDKKPCTPVILHFGSRNVPRFVYQYSAEIINIKMTNHSFSPGLLLFMQVWLKCLPIEAKYRTKRIIKKILPIKAIGILKK